MYLFCRAALPCTCVRYAGRSNLLICHADIGALLLPYLIDCYSGWDMDIVTDDTDPRYVRLYLSQSTKVGSRVRNT